MTAAGVERKATCRALFSKLLYLIECDALLPQDSEARNEISLQEVKPLSRYRFMLRRFSERRKKTKAN